MATELRYLTGTLIEVVAQVTGDRGSVLASQVHRPRLMMRPTSNAGQGCPKGLPLPLSFRGSKRAALRVLGRLSSGRGELF
jgi:hypothetical protein